ncbi:MAG TPA: hypothetical protein VN703_07525 [Candidatus Sulfopaludibacter sp.]|nr:hypothetical protein [Candidatus Sulfopaludibacter sp.]
MQDPYYHDKESQRYKTCAGSGCLNKPTSKLKIKYINKNGFFCEKCSNDLLQSNLAERIIIDDINE